MVALPLLVLLLFALATPGCPGGGACGASAILAPEAISAWLGAAASIGILTSMVCLLMIAGELDLSVGAVMGVSGMTVSLGMTGLGLSPVGAAALAIAVGLVVGLLNGVLVTRSGLPSLVVTLATLLVLWGAAAVTPQLLPGGAPVMDRASLAHDPFVRLVAGELPLGALRVPASVGWWLALTAGAAWVLFRTAFGNWVLGVGGDRRAAADAGVPVARVRISLFMASAATGVLVALIHVFRAGALDPPSSSHVLAVEPVAASVIGGTLFTGGLGSPVAAALGALSLAVAKVGIPLAGLAPEWYLAILGVTLLAGISLARRYGARFDLATDRT